ncbi:GH36-type glycosyl hydrolase domain-containing protein [Telmatospirillum sp.]|uniref:GH36-type glycosyl hydrolase domain-containing protein n=1 Tax=Telmatospirillum sp. TaxID=2079197 RepID=UPI00284D32F9|nr:glucoamylase family protein [Telmatospirillum sp.]MDR3437723.1 glucoamylase family protein [Telmatospirillum sp.]
MTSLIRRVLRHMSSTPSWNSRNPIREELFGIERLEEHARSLAAAQLVKPKPARGHPLAGRLADNGAVLLDAYRSIAKAIDEGGVITPAAEWLVDNYHLVERHIREIRSDLPAGYYRQLPKLAAGPFAGYPRVFGIAWAFIAHTDSRFDKEMLIRYMRAYQEVQPLTIGELWAVSITLRIVLVENLRRLVTQILEDRTARSQADGLADRLLGVGGHAPEPVSTVLVRHEHGPLADAFAVQLVLRLRDQDPRITPALTWLDRRLSAQNMTADAVVRDVHRSQGASNVTVRNIITSMRLISDVDWTKLFERISLVDEVLAEGSIFRDMDFPTRNLYRSAIENLARGANRTEIDVARNAVLAAQRARATDLAAKNTDKAELEGDPGYHLLAGGRPAFETTIGFRLPLHSWATRLTRAFGIHGYGSAITIVAAALLALPLVALASLEQGTLWLCALGILGAIPAIDAAVALVNRAVTYSFGATPLPALDLLHGVPEHLRTLVAVPTLLTSRAAIAEQIERLEIHHLASPGGDLHFAMLSDWTDAETETVAGDQPLLALAAAGIANLNQRYGQTRPDTDGGSARFLLLHRRRVWNESEGRWIGWERKRGKLHELNRLLRGATDTTFVAVAGTPPHPPADVRYVVTLDADTRLPRDTVRRLIGKMAHPLNRPRFDDIAGRVVEGYAILQPRVTPSLPVGQEGSLFQRTFSSLSGIDPYASAVSDVYQDLSGEGSYAGKGIYDVDAFERSLAGRVPDSTLLSHDLFEGVFARAGLASDVEVVEEYPARYDVGALRHHRWARGDWQLLPWILGIRQRSTKGKPNATRDTKSRAWATIPAIGLWKMRDNLRRTLSAPMAVLALLAGWTRPFDAALVWTLFVLSTIVVPTLIPVVAAIRPGRPGITIASHLRALGGDFRSALTQSAFLVIFLAHQAWLMGDAITRTLWRLAVSRRHLLEWVTAAQTTIGRSPDLKGSYRRMSGALGIGVATLVLIGISELLGSPGHGTWPLGSWLLATPFVALWAASPAVARWVSLSPSDSQQLQMSDSDTHRLRLVARRTWRFFESFVTPTDHLLPPDNFQDNPIPVLAHRTSPTNLGLYLLSVVSARDFGWIGTAEAVDRLEGTLATMSGLARFRGHFYNWYDTKDLRPLDPKYVSSVDSGNLAGHLIALANACQDWKQRPPSASTRLAGIADAIDLTREEAAGLHDGRLTQTVTWRQFDDTLTTFAGGVRQTSDTDLPLRLTELVDDAENIADIAQALAVERGDASGVDMQFWAQASLNAIRSHNRDLKQNTAEAATVAARLTILEDTARSMALAMEFGFLFDQDRHLLSIGYLVPEGTLDTNCYDLLASEARLASFVAIAKGDIPARHWFRLGRTVTPVARDAALISWSGSMFEYLMPSLIMREPAGSLLERTNRLIVHAQIDYAATRHIPWGISESAYNARDLEFTYQYSNFGVPGLGLKRGLGENLVIAPYATALASMIDPRAAAANLARLEKVGARGRYGFYEALDYTPIRLPIGDSIAVVHAFMAHHQGMSIVAIADALLDGAMRTRFHAEPIVQATELLLQERPPRDVAVAHPWATEVPSTALARDIEPAGSRTFTSAGQMTPPTHLLSNGRFATMLTAAGSGYSRWGDIALTRWREDATCDDFGSYIFLRDVRNGEIWSAGFQPSGAEPDEYQVTFREDRAEFIRRDGALTTTLDVLVSAEGDAEVRRVSISNTGNRIRELEITSYAELVLAPQATDAAHPAFSKLFVETEYLADVGAILATRRRRTPVEPEIWAAHLAVVDGDAVGRPEIETDRARFLGRGHDIRTPMAVIDGRSLSNTVGTVLDPIFALRRRVRVAPGAVVRVAYWTLAASTREALLDSVDKHRDSTAFGRATTLAWTQAQVQLHHLGITAGEAALFQNLAGHVVHAASVLRPASDTIRRGGGAQSGLWAQGLSGDLPIVLLRIADSEYIDIAHQLLQAHEYWRMKQLAVDLVILNERQSSYVQDLQIAIETLVRTSQSRPHAETTGPTGRVFVLRADLIPIETRTLLTSVARIVLVAQRGSLFDQLERIQDDTIPARSAGKRPVTRSEQPAAPPPPPELEFYNGLGGFADGGQAYMTILGPGQSTPAPWINVIANPSFGFQVATEGSGYTWAVNSRENQLTPWSNDPVTDRPGEAFYVRDDDTGDLWTPTALPIRDEQATYVACHGRGYSQFTHTTHGIASDLLQYVPLDAPLKISRLQLHNQSSRVRTLKVTAYVEWVLGPSRATSLPFVTTEIDAATGAMFARNPWSTAFGSRVAFIDMCGRQTTWTGDRREFIGRNGTLASPAALVGRMPLSNTVGAGLDPCGAMTAKIELQPNSRTEIVFFLGETANADEARRLVTQYREIDLDAVRRDVERSWDDLLGAVEVRTPDRPMDIMLNGWLLYQTLSCRIWARSAFYQASGAYGFRDQLQDGMALATTRPAITREHLLRAAGRQFIEGDVQHWWLPHSGQGVRTRISDDRAWLAYTVANYVGATRDVAVLDEVLPFLEGGRLGLEQKENYFQPTTSDETATLFEHCARGLDQSLALGSHGLPLFGTGDWNDGMNRVGEQGRGESVWLGWFLYAALTAFQPLAEARGDVARASTWRAHADALRASLDREAWNGEWYLRGWFDNGTPLGSANNQDCRIDSIAQSWSVLSGAGTADHADRSMAAVERELILPHDQLALLFAPPFDKATLNAGYIEGYPPGIRENGGQYTHAALWSVMAFAELGDGDKAAGLFSLLNPINHARTRAGVFRYKVEPYVVAADVYATPPHVGRGGWTWYTGSAGWMQRAGIESILGLTMRGDVLCLDPCIPTTWPRFEMTVRHRSARYEIVVENPDGIAKGILSATVDGTEVARRPLCLPLLDDGGSHHVQVKLGVPPTRNAK